MCAVPNMEVFCSSPISYFPGMLLKYFVNNFEMVPVAPVSTGITFAFTFHMRCIIKIILIIIFVNKIIIVIITVMMMIVTKDSRFNEVCSWI